MISNRKKINLIKLYKQNIAITSQNKKNLQF